MWKAQKYALSGFGSYYEIKEIVPSEYDGH